VTVSALEATTLAVLAAAGGPGHRGEPALADQPVEQLGVVHDLVVAAELRVFVLQRVEAVRAGHDDLAWR
jgi:hypothetical protein